MLAPSLYQFFHRQVQHAFGARGLGEPETVDYVSDVLTRFAHTSALYALHDTDGTPLEYIAQMLLERQKAEGEGGARDRSRQATITRHVGEYSLFMSGLFRERLQKAGRLNYYLDHGRSAYWQSADMEINPKRSQVFRRLYFELERVSRTLDYIRRVQFPLDIDERDLNTPLVAVWRN